MTAVSDKILVATHRLPRSSDCGPRKNHFTLGSGQYGPMMELSKLSRSSGLPVTSKGEDWAMLRQKCA